ncbi:hypothetical protein [Parvibacter caecicola]|uniref:EbhA n=1 Tax=Parvibacter caecicola TaxID=747645 RepID=A0A7W5D2R8_9ACTN|nr:hypothetical protein [Parvibacter caecicola]MBB3171671.1 hypothetical protein [Parvibacter caecicola]MCR2040928.1 hypothetical protein [Parvibacter caecicola]RNL10741.1 hypothetical protein DMP11_06750 [Parvibacter caecicola]
MTEEKTKTADAASADGEKSAEAVAAVTGEGAEAAAEAAPEAGKDDASKSETVEAAVESAASDAKDGGEAKAAAAEGNATAEEPKTPADSGADASAAEAEAEQGSPEPDEHRGIKMRVAVAIACVIVVAACAIATVVTTNFADYQKAVDSYQRSAAALQERNEELDQAVASLQFLVNSGAQPLEPQLITDAQQLISEAKGAKDSVTPMPLTTDEIRTVTNKIRISGNYAQLIGRLNAAEDALEDSIALRELVVDPTASNVIERLRTVPHIIAAEAVTPENDPNGLLNQADGYSSMVYFTYSLILQDKVYGEGVVGKGTSGGGSVEVYPTVELAEARNDYISQFDNTDLAPGYHEVVGSIVVRISDRLTPERQKKLADEVVEALTTLPDDEKE